jgi:hypothetical protein
MFNVYINSIDDNSTEDQLYQSPTGSNRVLNCNFYFKDEEILDNKTKIDFVVIFNRAKPSRLLKKININNTLLLANEPVCVHKYNQKYLGQFRHVFVSDPGYKGTNKQKGMMVAPWTVGQARFKNGFINKSHKEITFQELKKKIFNKTKLISVIETNKRLCEEHYIRDRIISVLKQNFPNEIDSFGRDSNFVFDKLDALKEYYYHICISNYWGKDHIDDRIYDPLIAQCNPIYLGADNIQDYFGTKFYQINPYDMNYNINLVRNIINKKNHSFEFSKQRDMVFDKYNYFFFLAEFIKNNYVKDIKIGSIKIENYCFVIKHSIKKTISKLLNK